MKKIFITAIAFAVLIACNNESKTGTVEKAAETKEEKPAETSITDNPDYAAGLELIAKSDCLTCHKVDEKLTGPSYRDVANKYASQAPGIIPQLADKIVKGGTGVWGQVPMLPHPTISQEDAEKMVKYILLLKNN
jgi:cytochrome c